MPVPHFLFVFLVFLLSGCSGGSSSSPATGLYGQINAAQATAVDSDLNDPNAVFTRNDEPHHAQPLTAPVVVGGFASGVGTFFSGDRFAFVADEFDSYRVELSAGQQVLLWVSDFDPSHPEVIDLDLWLYRVDDTSTPVASSLEVSEFEMLSVPEDGSYFVVVSGFAGASNYSLQIGYSLLAEPMQRQFDLTADFETGELLAVVDVPFADELTNMADAGSEGGPAQNSAWATGWKQRWQAAGGRLSSDAQSSIQRLRFDPHADGATIQRQTAATKRNWSQGKFEPAWLTIKRLKELYRTEPELRHLSLNYRRQVTAVPTDPLYNLQWHYSALNLPAAWDHADGSGVVVAVVDTGVLISHPDLAGSLTSDGYDFISSIQVAGDGDGIDDNPDDPGDGVSGVPSSFHGTHVAGTVAALADNSRGGVGSAFGAKVMPIRVLGRGGGRDYDLIQGIRYAAGLSNDARQLPTRRADIINLSLGGSGYSSALQQAISDARAAGVIVIAAAGNEASGQPHYPAAMTGVISVSAVRVDNRLAPYSNYGATIDLAAPGGDASRDQNGDGYPDGILSTLGEGSGSSITPSWNFYQGTSMASPHVAGVAALMLQLDPAMQPDDFDLALQSGAITLDLGSDGALVRNDRFGYGLIDALKAVRYAQTRAGGGGLPALPQASPATIYLDSRDGGAALTLSNAGEGSLALLGWSADVSWISLAEISVDSNWLGEYRLGVASEGLAPGVHNGRLILDFDADGVSVQLQVPVAQQVIATSGSADVGLQYLLLLTEDQETVLEQLDLEASNGRYPFSLPDLEPGRYVLIAGSDFDNDGFICDAGESCGGYPVLGQLETISLDGSGVRVDFVSSFQFGFSGDQLSANRAFALKNAVNGPVKRRAP